MMCSRLCSSRWVTTEDTRYNDFMAQPKEYLVRLIMGLGDMARYDNDRKERERLEAMKIC